MPEKNSITQILGTLETTFIMGETRNYGSYWAADYGVASDSFGRIYWISQGEGWTEHHGTRYRLEPGYLYVIPADTLARYGCPEEMTLSWLHFTAHVLYSVDLFVFLRVPFQIPVADTAWMNGQWDDLTMRLMQDRPGNAMAIDGTLKQLLAIFIDKAEVETEHIEGAARFHEVLGYIEANLTDRCTLSELADVANLHPTYFSTLFTRAMGDSPTVYVNRRRVEWAKRLLRDTRSPLQEIASTVGFCDPYYFSRVFKRLTGTTPGRFRNQPTEHHP